MTRGRQSRRGHMDPAQNFEHVDDVDFDRSFASHFRVLTQQGKPRSLEEREAGVDLESRYPHQEDPRYQRDVQRQMAHSGDGELPERRRSRHRAAATAIEPDIAPIVDEPESDPLNEPRRAHSMDQLDRILGKNVMTEAEPSPRAYIPPSKKVDHCTPHVIDRLLLRFDPSGVDLDPCASTSGLQIVEAGIKLYGVGHGVNLPEIDGLEISWIELLDGRGFVFVNCPYGRGELDDWIPKIVSEVLSSDLTVIALLPERCDRKVYQKYVTGVGSSNAVCYIRGRLKFVGSKDSAPFPSILVIWTNSESAVDKFEQVCADDIDEKIGRPLGNVIRTPRSTLDDRLDSREAQVAFLVERLGLDRDRIEDQIEELGFDLTRDRILSGFYDAE